MKRKRETDELAMKRKREKDESVDDILAAEAKKEQQQRRKPATMGKARQAKSLKRPVEDNPWHRPEPVTTAPEQAPEPPTVIVCKINPDDPATYGLDNRPFGDTPPREVSRPALVAFAVDIIRQEGPQSTNVLLDRAFPGISSDDRRALRQRLPKWLMASYRFADPPLTMRRERSPEGGEKREHLFGFWPEPRHGKTRQAVDVAEVLTAIAELKTELVTLRQVQSELLQRQNLLKEGFAAMLEKLTWNGEL
jgi:hypothetical protein